MSKLMWLVVSILTVLLAVKAYRYEDLDRFQQQGNRECWDAMLVDVRSKITPLGSCFYPKNGSLPEKFVPELFLNGSHMLPGVLFNPMNYAMYVGFTDAMYFSHSTFKLQSYEGMPEIESKTLDKAMAVQIMDGDDEMMQQRYRHFCAVKAHLRPILQCLANEIPGLLQFYQFYCTKEQSDDVQLAMQLSMINWDLHDQLCEEIFQCSAQPIVDCRAELMGNEGHHMAPMTTMDSLCVIMPHFDDMFAPCVRRKIRNCPNRVKKNYNTFIYNIQQVTYQFMRYPAQARSLCRILESSCEEQVHWELMNQVTNKCFTKLYEINIMSGGQSISKIQAGEYMDVDKTVAEEICRETREVQTCLRRETTQLPCQVEYVFLVGDFVEGLNKTCTDAMHSEPPPIYPPRTSDVSGSYFETPPYPTRSFPGAETIPPFETTTVPDWIRRITPAPTSSTKRPVPPMRTTPRRTTSRTTRRTRAPVTVTRPPTTIPSTRRVEQQVEDDSRACCVAPFLHLTLLPILAAMLS